MVKKSTQTNTNIIIMTILMIVILILTAIIINDKFLTEEKDVCETTKPIVTPQPTTKPTPTPTPEPSKETTDKIELGQNDPTVSKLISNFIPIGENLMIMDGWKPTLINESSEYRLIVAYENLDESLVKETTCANYNLTVKHNKFDTEAGCGTKGYNGDEVSTIPEAERKNRETLVIKGSDLKAKYKELFGTNYEYKAETFDTDLCGITQFYYFKDKDEYVTYSYGSGCAAGGANNTFKTAYKEENKLIIKTEYEDMVAKTKTTLTYEFKLENGNYTFIRVVEE